MTRLRDILGEVMARVRLSPLDRAYLHLGEVVTDAALVLDRADAKVWGRWNMKKNTALALAIQARRGTNYRPLRGGPDDV